jgi:phospholipid/cholesterol/gamma-HCH transport system permease protein
MADSQTISKAGLERRTVGDTTRIAAHGAWTIDTVAALEREVPEAVRGAAGRVTVDLSGITFIDTAGAWLISRIEAGLRAGGAEVAETGVSANARRLLDAVEPALHIPVEVPERRFFLWKLLELLGRATVNSGQDFLQAMSILGGVVRGLFRAIGRPARFRFTSIVYHLDRTGLQAVPIICLISLLIGGIIAQQGVFQLSFFGAEDFVVDLVGILILREIGVLLTAIMLAGRSGSAYTAEIGSMKMREELDALKVIGLDPVEVLIMPRLLALVIALPLLTFISDMFGLIGGALVAFVYGNMAFQRFVLLLRDAIDMSTLMVGLIKAPFMGLIVGLIAANEGLNVAGSAESLGRQTTSSVVKAIFMVIVADGIFAIFFAAIDY